MPTFKLNGNTYSGSTNYASAIEYIEEDGNKTTVQDKISELNSNLTGVVVWTNPNPSASFANQTVSIDISKYQRFKIILKASESSDNYVVREILGKGSYRCDFPAGSIIYRDIVFSDNSIAFGNTRYVNTYGGSTVTDNNGLCIPVSVIGFEY